MDELPPRDLDAWEVDELPADFEDRVMARLEAGPSPAEPSATVHPLPRRRRVVPLVAVAVAMAAALTLVWSRGPSPAPTTGTIAAAEETRVVRPRPGVEAVVSPGGALRWSEQGDGLRVEQDHGEVRYQITPGTAVAVHTPAGIVEVTGTLFTVEVVPVSEASQRNSRILLSTAAVAATVIAVVVVHEGSVDAHNERGRTEVRAGSRAVMSDASAPHLAPEEAPQLAQAPTPAPSKPRVSEEERRRHAATRKRIEQALAQRAAARPPEPSAEEPPPEPSDPFNGLRASLDGNLDREYVREAIKRDLIPLAHDCYGSVLEVDPEFGGRLVLEFDIMGDEEVGGIVDDAKPGEGTDMMHPEFLECMSESMMTVMFPPPEGGGVVHVTYPFLFEPG